MTPPAARSQLDTRKSQNILSDESTPAGHVCLQVGKYLLANPESYLLPFARSVYLTMERQDVPRSWVANHFGQMLLHVGPDEPGIGTAVREHALSVISTAAPRLHAEGLLSAKAQQGLLDDAEYLVATRPEYAFGLGRAGDLLCARDELLAIDGRGLGDATEPLRESLIAGCEKLARWEVDSYHISDKYSMGMFSTPWLVFTRSLTDMRLRGLNCSLWDEGRLAEHRKCIHQVIGEKVEAPLFIADFELYTRLCSPATPGASDGEIAGITVNVSGQRVCLLSDSEKRVRGYEREAETGLLTSTAVHEMLHCTHPSEVAALPLTNPHVAMAVKEGAVESTTQRILLARGQTSVTRKGSYGRDVLFVDALVDVYGEDARTRLRVAKIDEELDELARVLGHPVDAVGIWKRLWDFEGIVRNQIVSDENCWSAAIKLVKSL